MRIVSYNVNGLRPRLLSPPRTLSAFLDSLNADIICLQETKIARHDITADLAVAEGYESFFSCNRTFKKGRIGYSGVATFCRIGLLPSSTSPILPLAADEGFTGLLHRSQNGDIESTKGRVGYYEEVAKTEMSMQDLLQLDSEGRCLVTDHGSFVLFNLYCPKADYDDMDRLKFKGEFFKTLQRRWEALLNQNRRIIAVGDFNVSPYPIDSCRAGPDFDKHIIRKQFRSLLKHEGGPFWDVFRFFHPDRKDAYTCWSQASGAEEFNFGSRIDLVLAAGCCNHDMIPGVTFDETSHGFVECEVQDCDILTHFRRLKPDTHPRWQGGRSMKLEGSDHAPIVVHLNDQGPVEPHEAPPLAARFMPEIRGRQQNLVALLKRQFPSGDSKGVDSKVEFPTIPSNSGPVPGKIVAVGSIASLFNVKRASPSSNNSAKGKKTQGSSASGIKMKKQGISQKSPSQQRDLRAFFVSPSQPDISAANEKIGHSMPTSYGDSIEGETKPSCNSAAEQSFIGNLDSVDLTESLPGSANSVFGKTTPDHNVLDSKKVDDMGGGIFTDDGEDQCTGRSQIQSDDSGTREILLDNLTQLEQIRAVEKIELPNVAWSRIKERMARAVPLCKGHDEPCVARVVKRPGPNIGRGFYVCARAEGPSSNPEARCDHFEWASSFKKGGKS